MAVDENSDNIIFGECKFTNKPMDIDIYYDLIEKKQYVNWKNRTRVEHFVFFSFSGYTDKMIKLAEKEQNVVLY